MPTVSKDFIKDVFAAATAELQKAGWAKKRPNIFAEDLSDDAYGRVGLNKAIGRGNGVLEINPIVGVGSHRLEKFVAELLGQKFQPYVGAAIGCNVGYLMPEKRYRPWLFRELDDWKAPVADMVAAIDVFGRPFILKNAELAALYASMKNSKLGGPHDQYRIPAACVILGKNLEAATFLDAQLAEIGSRDDMDAQLFKRFATRLRQSCGP
jgi:hypothetical protein